jgi:putative nucleotidyltransferase with HDIG domain
MQFISGETKLRERFFATLDGIRDIPTFPSVASNLARAMARPEFSMREVAEAVQQDPAVTVRLLKLVNSAYYRPITGGAPISSVPYAVTRVGLGAIRDIVTTLSVFSVFPGAWTNVDRLAFWRHCLETARTARLLLARTAGDGTSAGEADDDGYAAGLLHDIGFIVLDRYFQREFAGLLTVAGRAAVPLHEVETAMLGIDHAAIGATVARRWDLPASIVAAMAYHHDPDAAPEEYRALCAAVHVADFLCREGEIAPIDREAASPDPRALDVLGLTDADLDEVSAVARTPDERADALTELSV